MNTIRNSKKKLSVAVMVAFGVILSATASANKVPYGIWGSDQSNSVLGKNVGTDGSFIWVWDSEDMLKQIEDGTPMER